MDAGRFDTLLRSLSAAPSRRRVVRLLAGSVVGGLLGRLTGHETAAHNTLQKCRTIDNKAKRKRCVKKARAHNATHTCVETTCCRCNGGSNPFCRAGLASLGECADACTAGNPDNTGGLIRADPGKSWVCDDTSVDGCALTCER